MQYNNAKHFGFAWTAFWSPIVVSIVKMAFHQLPQRQEDIIRECMVAIAQGPFLEEWEFQTRMGSTRAELDAVLT